MLTEQEIAEFQDQVRKLNPKGQRDVYEHLKLAEQAGAVKPPISHHFSPETLYPQDTE